jgi:hypothetical protein
MYFLNFNKYNVIPTVGGYGQRWGMINPQERGMPRECLRGVQGGEIFMGINSNPHFLNFIIIWGNLLFFV